jgi:hypothetical protein
METLHPSNVEDADIPIGITYLTEESYNVPLTSPTSMSYFLHRIESATLVRQVVDRLPPSFFSSPALESGDDVYDDVMALDRKYQQFIKGLPPFFQLVIEDVESHQALLKDQPYLEWQRYLINFILHTQLARLHRPFIIRGSRHAKYKHSHRQCIQSAETVIEIRNRALGGHSTGSLIYVLQHFLTAAIILAMDVCFNPDRAHAPRRKQNVLLACRALEEELNAKVLPANGIPTEGVPSGQLMVRSFQNAVQNLRGILRKNVRQDESSDSAAATPSIERKTPRERWRGSNVVTRAGSSSLNAGVNRPSESAASCTQDNGTDAHIEVLHGENQDAANTATSFDQIGETDGDGDLVVDALWDDLFTFGATFDDTDWDGFFSGVGANMGRG